MSIQRMTDILDRIKSSIEDISADTEVVANEMTDDNINVLDNTIFHSILALERVRDDIDDMQRTPPINPDLPTRRVRGTRRQRPRLERRKGQKTSEELISTMAEASRLYQECLIENRSTLASIFYQTYEAALNQLKALATQ